jgi:hypothetical protein
VKEKIISSSCFQLSKHSLAKKLGSKLNFPKVIEQHIPQVPNKINIYGIGVLEIISSV